MYDTQIAKHIKDLIDTTERELVQMMVQAWVYQKEVDKPTNMGKEEAQKGLDTYNQRIKHLETFISVYNQYAQENELKI